MPRLRTIGPGRAGTSLSRALETSGWDVETPLGREDVFDHAARDVDLLVIATPDAAIAEVACAVQPEPKTVVAHLAGARGLDVLGTHPRRAALHPLVSLPDATIGAERLASGAWFAIAGDPFIRKVVDDLEGRCVEVPDDARVRYHAAACIASNHLVALFGQVERIAAEVGVPLEAYLTLARETLANVAALGPAKALTGPVARGDTATVEAHVAALPEDEREGYRAMAAQAKRLLRPAD